MAAAQTRVVVANNRANVRADEQAGWIVERVRATVPGGSRRAVREALDAATTSERGLLAIRRHLEQYPDALTTGRSNLPPVVCAFVVALAAAGTGARLPECARCGRSAPRLPRAVHGGRICQSCVDDERREPCSRCGRSRAPVARDAAGPVCAACRARDPDTHVECSRCRQVARVAARSNTGAVLCTRCYRRTRPAERCCRCGQDRPVSFRTADGGPVCERCYRSPAQLCDGCGRVRPLKTRRTATQPALCIGCYRGKIATCTGCGRLRPTKRCTARNGEPTCDTCTPRNQRECTRCGRVKRILTRWPIGEVCGTCYAWVRKHPAPCARCRATRPLIGTTPSGDPLCGPCAGQPNRDYTCPRCGEAGFAHTAGRCLRCEAGDRVRELVTGDDGTIPAKLEPFATALAVIDSPSAVLQWLRAGQPAARLLEQIRTSGEPVTHQLLDQLPPGLALHRLRQTLVHTGCLPARAEYLELLAPWLDTLLVGHPPTRAHVLRTYVTWTVLRAPAAAPAAPIPHPAPATGPGPECSPRYVC